MKKLNLLKSLGIASMFLFALVLVAPNYGYAAVVDYGADCGGPTGNTCTAGTACKNATAGVAGKCRYAANQNCSTNGECASDICTANRCVGGASGSTGVNLTGDNTRQVGVLVSTELNQSQDLIGTISTVINWFLGFVGIIVFGIFLIAGFEYATAGGDAGKTETAQKRMTNAVIGMVILFFAFTASNTILTFVFGGVQTGSFQ